jgi:transposase-like protein
MIAPKLSKLQNVKDEIIQKYNNGDSFDSLASIYKVNPSTIRRFLLFNGVKFRPPVRPQILEKHSTEVITLYRTGKNTRELGEQFGVDRNTVSIFLDRKGVLRKSGLTKKTFSLKTDADRGMFTGLLIGEGSIIIRGKGAIITITNQDAAVIGWLQRLGGKAYWYAPRYRSPNPCGTWRLSGSIDVFHCLNSIYGLLIGKKKPLATAAINVLKANYDLTTEVPAP